ncbi:uncharacterized protein [Branchiostoma lanceolatum]|uniref:uncharacterized protein n=1 Tax=Branchiostoma lanceolatum TaxID=7740 RepID=UPI003451F25B
MKILLVAILITAILICSSESRAVSDVLLERLDSETKEERHLAIKKNGQDVVIDPEDDWYSAMMGKRTSIDSHEEGRDLQPTKVRVSGHKARSEIKVDEGRGES